MLRVAAPSRVKHFHVHHVTCQNRQQDMAAFGDSRPTRMSDERLDWLCCTMARLSQLAAKQTTRETLDRATADRNSVPSITCAAFVGVASVAHSLRMIMVLRATTKNESGHSLTFRGSVPMHGTEPVTAAFTGVGTRR